MRGGEKWGITPERILQREEIQALQRCATMRVREGQSHGRTHMLEHVVLEIALGSGLRVSEIVGLDCGHLSLGAQSGSIFVRNGKGGKQRTVIVSKRLCHLLGNFMRWKRTAGEPADKESPLVASKQTGGRISARALQKMFGRLLEAARVSHHRFHDLRHTYGSFLLRASDNDLVFVRDQMGHSDLTTTAVYLHALNAERAVNALYV